jgi:hypothetical protein
VVGETADMAVSLPCAENVKDAAGYTCMWSRTAAGEGMAVWDTGEAKCAACHALFCDERRLHTLELRIVVCSLLLVTHYDWIKNSMTVGVQQTHPTKIGRTISSVTY